MIKSALDILRDEIKQYLTGRAGWSSSCKVELANIARLDFEDTASFKDTILVSLVNTENEKLLRNNSHNRSPQLNGEVTYQNPKLFINLYILICINFEEYSNALHWLSLIFEFFQSKNVFTSSNSPGIHDYDGLSDKQKANFKLIMELETLSYEQLNHLWGTIGGKQIPSIHFKGRLVKISSDQVHGTGPPITGIQTTETIK